MSGELISLQQHKQPSSSRSKRFRPNCAQARPSPLHCSLQPTGTLDVHACRQRNETTARRTSLTALSFCLARTALTAPTVPTHCGHLAMMAPGRLCIDELASRSQSRHLEAEAKSLSACFGAQHSSFPDVFISRAAGQLLWSWSLSRRHPCSLL